MGRTIGGALAVMFVSVILAACGGGGDSAPEPPVDRASAPAPRPTPEPPSEPTRGPDPGATPPRVDAPPPSPGPVSASEPTPASEPAPSAKSSVHDPGGIVEVAPTVEGAARIGAEKCKVCHKIQYESWSRSAHATRAPSLDCEGCHGPGSEYKAIAVMKDPAKARASGLVMPAKEFCTTCHESGWTDEMLAAVHAHKPK